MKPAELLSLDGSRTLAASVIAYAFYGTDGLPSTVSCAAWEWAWTYQVDLEKSYQVGRIVVTFGGGFATEFRVETSIDKKEWRTLKEEKNGNGEKVEIIFVSMPIRYIRVVGLKPDGPNQKGGQMNIGELEAYAAD